MSTLAINYYNIEASIKNARKTASSLDRYAQDMNSIASNCYSVTGTDTNGYISTAANLAKRKASEAIQEKSSLERLASQLSSFETFAKEKDSSVERTIDVTVSNYVGRRTFFQAIGDWIYSVYTGFLDHLTTVPIVGKYLSQAIRKIGNWISDTNRTAYNYFKYGDGKYIWNTVKTVTAVFVALAGFITACIAAVAAAPALAVIAIVGAVAAGIYLLCKFGDMMASADSNIKAYKLARDYHEKNDGSSTWWESENNESSLTAARYYGNIKGIKDLIGKTDFGGEQANNRWKIAGNTYSFIENASAIVSAVCQVTVALGNAQYLKDANGNWIRNVSGEVRKKNGSFIENVRITYSEKVGYTFEKTPIRQNYARKGGEVIYKNHDFSKAFKFKFFEGYTSKFQKANLELPAFDMAIINGSKLFKNIDGVISNIETLHEWDHAESFDIEQSGEAFSSFIDLSKNVEFADTYFGDIKKTIDNIGKILDDIRKHVKPSENAYEAYLASTLAASGGGGGMGGR